MTREQNPTPAQPGSSEEPSLETRLRRLDEIVAQLEGGDAELEAGLSLFEEGVRHIREAEALLARAELRVEELVGGEGDTRTRKFEGEGNGGGGA
jgi:exodeoxyribonuclease VII small subunit